MHTYIIWYMVVVAVARQVCEVLDLRCRFYAAVIALYINLYSLNEN